MLANIDSNQGDQSSGAAARDWQLHLHPGPHQDPTEGGDCLADALTRGLHTAAIAHQSQSRDMKHKEPESLRQRRLEYLGHPQHQDG